MSNFKLEKSIINHKLKVYTMDDIDKTKFTIRPLPEIIRENGLITGTEIHKDTII